MKKLGLIIMVAALLGCQQGTPKRSFDLKTDQEQASYSIGVDIGQSFIKQELGLIPELVAQGLEEAMNELPLQMSDEDREAALATFQTTMMEKQNSSQGEAAEKNKKEGAAFLEANKVKDGVVTTASGLQYKIMTPGTGRIPKATDTVETNYQGTLIDGKVFDSSYKRGQTVSFPVSGVIKGWTEALQLMKEGAKWQLFIPSDLAYGPRGAGGDIGPNATLIFEIELVAIK